MLGAIFLYNGQKLFAMQANEMVQDFDIQQHGSQVERMLFTVREELFANPQFRILDMLLSKSITPQVKDSHNSLIMHVLKSTYPTKHPVRSFVAYEKSDSNVFIRLLVTHFEVQGNGYATSLITQIIKSLTESGITQFKFETRKQNRRAVDFYEKLLSSAKDVSYKKNEIQVDGTDVIRYEVTHTQEGKS